VIFIDILVKGGAKGDVTPDAGNPFVDATFDLKAICYCILEIERISTYHCKNQGHSFNGERV